jgi:hypothetical protein
VLAQISSSMLHQLSHVNCLPAQGREAAAQVTKLQGELGNCVMFALGVGRGVDRWVVGVGQVGGGGWMGGGGWELGVGQVGGGGWTGGVP